MRKWNKRSNASASPTPSANFGGRPRRVTDSHIRTAVRLVEGGEPAAQVARNLGMSRATFHRGSRPLKDWPRRILPKGDTKRSQKSAKERSNPYFLPAPSGG
ncbi:helix-turn-helix domain-containing protein [Arthrobacter sp. ok909]|uniref:helix-turn-helix domain-containing protein n=1 Tax=Arthrobacter sp. ok909 TaxID=1761746 RepID=UPI0020C8D7AC|nr:helix-turn-helix domain-containing protein [Arthrobacter sp. ok909]